jgi:translation initiation factor 1 (eIF-1/SUI1)
VKILIGLITWLFGVSFYIWWNQYDPVTALNNAFNSTPDVVRSLLPKDIFRRQWLTEKLLKLWSEKGYYSLISGVTGTGKSTAVMSGVLESIRNDRQALYIDCMSEDLSEPLAIATGYNNEVIEKPKSLLSVAMMWHFLPSCLEPKKKAFLTRKEKLETTFIYLEWVFIHEKNRKGNKYAPPVLIIDNIDKLDMDQLKVSQYFAKKFADSGLAHISFVSIEGTGSCKLFSSSMSSRMQQLVLSEMDREEALTYVKHCFPVIEDEKRWLVRASEILSITGGVLVHLNAINPQRFFEPEYPKEVSNLIYKKIANNLDVIDPVVCKAAIRVLESATDRTVPWVEFISKAFGSMDRNREIMNKLLEYNLIYVYDTSDETLVSYQTEAMKKVAPMYLVRKLANVPDSIEKAYNFIWGARTAH